MTIPATYRGSNLSISPIYSGMHPRDMVRVRFRTRVDRWDYVPGAPEPILFGSRMLTATPRKYPRPFCAQDTGLFAGWDRRVDDPGGVVPWQGYRDVHEPSWWFRVGDSGNGGRTGVRPLTRATREMWPRCSQGFDDRTDTTVIDCMHQGSVLGAEIAHEYWRDDAGLVAFTERRRGWGGRYVAGTATPYMPLGVYQPWRARLRVRYADGTRRTYTFRWLTPEAVRYIFDLTWHHEFLGVDSAGPYTTIAVRLWDFGYQFEHDTRPENWVGLQQWRVMKLQPDDGFDVDGYGFRVVDGGIECANDGGAGYVQPNGMLKL